MVRAPCCEKMGLKKGPWTSEEDQVLINYIQLYGHGNWRALPKQAGLLRCGKSCRLRWTNYLRPDIKRGNFSREEEETIINLHDMLGNRWSAIAAKLPGRTDNEIKNVWHTHLKKRINPPHQATPKTMHQISINTNQDAKKEQEPKNFSSQTRSESPRSHGPISLEQCSSDISSATSIENSSNNMCTKVESSEDVYEMDENFWSEVLSTDNSSHTAWAATAGNVFPVDAYGSNMYGSLDFWYNILTREGELPELLEI